MKETLKGYIQWCVREKLKTTIQSLFLEWEICITSKRTLRLTLELVSYLSLEAIIGTPDYVADQ